jgi:hypothetical protein
MPGLIRARDPVGVGDVMVDRSVRGSDCGRSVFVGCVMIIDDGWA